MSGCGIPGRHNRTSESTPYERVMSLRTCPTVSIRTVRATNGLESRNGFVRCTYIGVFNIRPNVCNDRPSRLSA